MHICPKHINQDSWQEQNSATSLGDTLLATNIKHNAAQKRAKGKEVDAGEEQWMADSNSSLKQKMLSLIHI